MPTVLSRALFRGGCAGLALLVLAGCSGSLSSLAPTPEPKRVPEDTILVADTDTTALDPEVARLYALESELLAADDSTRRAHLLNQAMAELATLLRTRPDALERSAVRSVYGGLTAEYRRFHGYPSDPDSTLLARGQIFSVRARLFAELEDVENPLLEGAPVRPEAEVEGTEIPMTSNRLVKQSTTALEEEPSEHVNHWRRRVQVYGPMIEHILAEEGVPQELKYLAMIESGLNPDARSWAGAVGMWQFMPGTGRRYGLTVNAWVDERRDPEKATRAAARHLGDLYDEFGDWHLALAGFNCGAGCVRSALRRADAADPSYWDAHEYLPRETQGYVPMFIAAARVMENPEAFDLAPPEPASPLAYDYVPIHGSRLSLRTVARLADTTRSAIESLNPELRRGRVPPSKERYYVRIPLGSYPRFAWNYAELPDEKKQPATTYAVRRGDTLSEIAVRFGTSTATLKRLNGISGAIIRPGDRLVVPVQEYASALSAADQRRPLRVQYDTSPPTRPLDAIETARAPSDTTSGPPDTSPASSPQTAASAPTSYRVTRGDTLGEIAQRFGVSIRELQAWNDLSGTRIRPGQRLQIRD
ncbi:membrane-bound lytic murein transglycosylase D [Salinibacter ruber]|uniref:lytic transglycosylase domain-containing protein n=1 Tax=Salinibacter ruber TaxID=146919 RepID=UPI00180EA0B7|nr:LysM peptidoglycan-binding domain-containing protein [Salinibacter ruber]MBB4061620.1 membrane-bound lytic murein transglycosylase D [Salinibacter ruber]MBB4070122.1 membrane-bound lytic murein transglycosylase D [Salinibacter ruber]MCS3934871.1 membrane-bound lytic murein transglycosylase D [Salinibacter ruber]MCS4042907.1 membrane-bound lytic murein transglycosylase D [Salinibacter ruber]MCS4052571.1 membrane-bound lytic murein transglycosylase D [Salinibacter ruber]